MQKRQGPGNGGRLNAVPVWGRPDDDASLRLLRRDFYDSRKKWAKPEKRERVEPLGEEIDSRGVGASPNVLPPFFPFSCRFSTEVKL